MQTDGTHREAEGREKPKRRDRGGMNGGRDRPGERNQREEGEEGGETKMFGADLVPN